MDSVVESIDRFGIEAIYAFKLCNLNTANASDLMHISQSSFYNDMTIIRNRTGLNPYAPEQFEQLYNMVEEYRKEKMHGAEINIGSYLCGE